MPSMSNLSPLETEGNQRDVTDAKEAAPKEKTFFGQPRGLANLFGVEMWERFSFYGMQAIVIYYMWYEVTRGGLGMDQASAASIMGAYGGLVYLACLAAALVADRMLGSERTLYYSAIMVMFGHIALAFVPGYSGLALGLVLIAIGSGGVKTNASVVLGQLYSRDDPRRDAGFTIFYLGVNIGALLGPALTSAVWGWKGFHWGFGIAAIGMFLGLAQYTLMRKETIKGAGHETPNPLPAKAYPVWLGGAAVLVIVCVWLVVSGIVKVVWLSNIVTVVALISAIGLWCQMYYSPLTTAKEKSRLVGFIPMFISGVLFFAIFQQQFTVLAFYSESRLNRVVFGVEIPPSLVQLFNPLFICAFSAVFAGMWTRLGDRQWSVPVKFAAANVTIGLSLLFFVPFSGGADNTTPMWALAWILFLFTMGELLLSPVGNSLATKVAPEAFPSRSMAMWMMAVAMGTALAGSLAAYYDPTSASSENTFFISLSVASVILGAVLFFLRTWILKKFVDIR
ncbi:proton-dependent oligopeptide transporter, POT family [Corynebacterium glucuronolyticum]|nr:Di-/tripeptide transporter [Corynebacterium glucuronolyticum DSM 44120]SMB77606.1 proton-dependent oligopeptide transporter, POT family [Corynebacterium glucuronolyticum]